jgi:hypothetical protein
VGTSAIASCVGDVRAGRGEEVALGVGDEEAKLLEVLLDERVADDTALEVERHLTPRSRLRRVRWALIPLVVLALAPTANAANLTKPRAVAAVKDAYEDPGTPIKIVTVRRRNDRAILVRARVHAIFNSATKKPATPTSRCGPQSYATDAS